MKVTTRDSTELTPPISITAPTDLTVTCTGDGYPTLNMSVTYTPTNKNYTQTVSNRRVLMSESNATHQVVVFDVFDVRASGRVVCAASQDGGDVQLKEGVPVEVQGLLQ